METAEQIRLPGSKLIKNQRKTYGWKLYAEHGRMYRIKAEVRHDDECGNGHNTFSITAEIQERRGSQFYEYSGGCCHDEVAKHFPELAPFVKWHLMSTDEPLHYVSDTIYLAGDRDCWGLRKGEFRQLRDRKTGLPAWILKELPQKHIDSESKPAPVLVEYEPWGRTGEGKERELDAARKAAIWPEATDDELSAEPEELKAKLIERMPALMQAFKRDVESLGFIY